MRRLGVLLFLIAACAPDAVDSTGTTDADPATTTVAGSWIELAPMQVARSEHPAAIVDDEIVIAGGFVEMGLGRSGATSAVEAYSIATDSWRPLPDLPRPVHHGMAAVVEDRLFMIGGYSADGDPIDTVLEFVDGAWVEMTPLPGPLAAAATAVLDDSIYVVGGFPDSALYRYNTADGSWTVLPRPEQDREHVAAVAVAGEIWAIAGRWLGEIWAGTEIYDPVAATWRAGPELNEARSGFGAVSTDQGIVAVGGEVFSPDAALDTVELYDPVEETWSFIDPLPYGLHGNPLVGLGSDIYLPGGSTRPAGVENDGRMYRLSLG
jgi:N-acetylneuraminic acid mutarotase